jgi:hypothetical protein
MKPPELISFVSMIGWIAVFIGLAGISITIALLRLYRRRNILVGAAFLLCGILIVSLDRQAGATHPLGHGVAADGLCGVLLLGFVVSLFALRTVLNDRAGHGRMSGTAPAGPLVWRDTFQTVSGIIMFVSIMLVFLVFLFQLVR